MLTPVIITRKRTITKKGLVFITISLISFLVIGCGNPDVALLVDNYESGKILIDNQPLDKKIIRIADNSEKKRKIFYLDLQRGQHEIKFSLPDGRLMKKSFQIKSESYFAVDLVSGELDGFD